MAVPSQPYLVPNIHMTQEDMQLSTTSQQPELWQDKQCDIHAPTIEMEYITGEED